MMKYYRLREDKIEVGDESTEDGINYKVSDVNNNTGQISWKVEYETDFITAYNKIQDALKSMNDLRVELDDGSKFNDAMSFIEKAKYAYRKVLKKDYPKAYKKIIQGKVNEISTSGATGEYQGKNIFYRLKDND